MKVMLIQNLKNQRMPLWNQTILERLKKKKKNTQKIKLTIAFNFISSKNIDNKRLIYSTSDNIEIMSYDKADEVIEEFSESILCRYQIGLETSMKGSDFIFDCVNLL